MSWYSARCIIELKIDSAGHKHLYEERVTVWECASFDKAIELAELDAEGYANDAPGRYVGLCQVYEMADKLQHGAEVFSLIRGSDLDCSDYLNSYFDDGNERQAQHD